MIGALIMDIGYGIKVESTDDKYIEIAEKAQEGLDPATDKNIVDIIPWSMYFYSVKARLPTLSYGCNLVQHVPNWLPGSFSLRDVSPTLYSLDNFSLGMGWKKQIDAYKVMALAMCDVPYEHVLQQLVSRRCP